MASNGITWFGINLLKSGVITGENGIVAPYSVASVLGMALLGAKGNTASEIKGTLNPSTPGLSTGTISKSEPISRGNTMDWDTGEEDDLDGSKPSTNVYDSTVTERTSDAGHKTHSLKKRVKLIVQHASSKDKLPFVVVDEDFHKALASTIRNEGENLTNGNTVPAYILRNANKLYIKRNGSVSKAFVSNSERLYQTKPKILNFGKNPEKCRNEINHWVENQTESKIKDLIPTGSISADTSIVIVNAIYFKGKWETEFQMDCTSQRTFNSLNRGPVQTDVMYNDDIFPHKVDAARECQVLELPYMNRDLSFFVILPDKYTDFTKFQAKLDSAMLSDLTSNMVEKEIAVYLPKFKMQVSLDLASVLQSLGINDLFEPGKADLTQIDSKGALYVSGVIHKAFIEVNEYGSEAAAATAEIVKAAGAPRKRTEFDADHPFIFLIKDNRTKAILFLGQFCQPEVSN